MNKKRFAVDEQIGNYEENCGSTKGKELQKLLHWCVPYTAIHGFLAA